MFIVYNKHNLFKREMEYYQKIRNLIEKISIDLKERDEHIKMSILALLGGESIFLLGPPGVAKSLLSRKILSILSDSSNFDYLMNRFSTPDEIFGPISIKKLDDDVYERKTNGYLPTAEIAFLDEIWKASPSIQNTLLTIINEKVYKNGNKLENVPLLLLIAASNELPSEGEGLEALYDRFIIRLYVNNIVSKENFRYVIDTHQDKTKISNDEKISKSDIVNIQELARGIKLDDYTFNFICELKEKLNITLKEYAPYISDRRWKKIVNLLKVSAIASDRKEIKPCDWLIVKNMIWENEDQQQKILPLFNQIWVDNVIKCFSFISISEAKSILNNLYNEFSNAYTRIEYIKKYSYNNEYAIAYVIDGDSNMVLINESELNNIRNKNNTHNYFYYYLANMSEKNNESFYSLPEKSEYYYNVTISDDFKWIDFKGKKYYAVMDIKEEINIDLLIQIKDKNLKFLETLNELSSNKNNLLNDLKNQKALLSSSYENYINNINSEITKLITELYEKSSYLSGKILSIINDNDVKNTSKNCDGEDDSNDKKTIMDYLV